MFLIFFAIHVHPARSDFSVSKKIPLPWQISMLLVLVLCWFVLFYVFLFMLAVYFYLFSLRRGEGDVWGPPRKNKREEAALGDGPGAKVNGARAVNGASAGGILERS